MFREEFTTTRTQRLPQFSVEFGRQERRYVAWGAIAAVVAALAAAAQQYGQDRTPSPAVEGEGGKYPKVDLPTPVPGMQQPGSVQAPVTGQDALQSAFANQAIQPAIPFGEFGGDPGGVGAYDASAVPPTQPPASGAEGAAASGGTNYSPYIQAAMMAMNQFNADRQVTPASQTGQGLAPAPPMPQAVGGGQVAGGQGNNMMGMLQNVIASYATQTPDLLSEGSWMDELKRRQAGMRY